MNWPKGSSRNLQSYKWVARAWCVTFCHMDLRRVLVARGSHSTLMQGIGGPGVTQYVNAGYWWPEGHTVRQCRVLAARGSHSTSMQGIGGPGVTQYVNAGYWWPGGHTVRQCRVLAARGSHSTSMQGIGGPGVTQYVNACLDDIEEGLVRQLLNWELCTT